MAQRPQSLFTKFIHGQENYVRTCSSLLQYLKNSYLSSSARQINVLHGAYSVRLPYKCNYYIIYLNNLGISTISETMCVHFTHSTYVRRISISYYHIWPYFVLVHQLLPSSTADYPIVRFTAILGPRFRDHFHMRIQKVFFANWCLECAELLQWLQSLCLLDLVNLRRKRKVVLSSILKLNHFQQTPQASTSHHVKK